MRIEDLKDTGRLLRLHDRAVAQGLVGASEADRLRFVGAAEHALSVGEGNPPGLFVHLIRGRHWRYLTQADEDRAQARLKREQWGPAATPSARGSGVIWLGVGPMLSADALLVRELRAALMRAGRFGDPLPALQRRDAGWTRGRWERALRELGLSRGGCEGDGPC